MARGTSRHVQALLALSKERLGSSEAFGILLALRQGKQPESLSDQAAVLVATAVLEQTIEEAISVHLVALDELSRQKVFEGDHEREGILGSIYSKSVIAQVLGIIGPNVARDLNAMRRLRNDLAHTRRFRNLSDEPFSALCDLHVVQVLYTTGGMKPMPVTPKAKMLAGAFYLSNYFLLYSSQKGLGEGIDYWKKLWG